MCSQQAEKVKSLKLMNQNSAEGSTIEGQWEFGGVERDSSNSFSVPVEHRDQKTLLPIIQKYILPGTTIISDCWKAYSRLSDFDYTHLTVNHSKNFKDPKTGACTDKIVGLWRNAKHRIPHYRRKKTASPGIRQNSCFYRKFDDKVWNQ